MPSQDCIFFALAAMRKYFDVLIITKKTIAALESIEGGNTTRTSLSASYFLRRTINSFQKLLESSASGYKITTIIMVNLERGYVFGRQRHGSNIQLKAEQPGELKSTLTSLQSYASLSADNFSDSSPLLSPDRLRGKTTTKITWTRQSNPLMAFGTRT
jgi:hypothetical protein